MTQFDIATTLGETQSFVSKCERGERRIDVAELLVFCRALGVSLPAFIRQFEQKLTASEKSQRRQRVVSKG